MTDEFIRVVEVEGVKLEVDLRTAKTIEQYKVGDPVRVLRKKWDKNYESLPGVILGFDDFPALPTIRLGYLEGGKFTTCSLNAKSEDDVQVAPMLEIDGVLHRDQVLDTMDRDITRKEQELSTAKAQREYFLEYFSRYWEQVTDSQEEAV